MIRLLFVSCLIYSIFSWSIQAKRLSIAGRTRPQWTACDRFGDGGNESTLFLQPAPLNRIVTVCEEDYNQLCTMLEFRAYLHVYYEDTKHPNEPNCHTIPIDLSPNPVISMSERRQLSELPPRKPQPTGQTVSSSTASNLNQTVSESTPVELHPDVVRVLTTDAECCNKTFRCFSIPLSNGSPGDPLDGWRLNFTWLRTPEPYEFGEEGWSSVGAPIGSLSGVYDLIRVHLTYVLRTKAGFQLKDVQNDHETYVVNSEAVQRFQARVGDFYECVSVTNITMTGVNATRYDNTTTNFPPHWLPYDPSWKPGLRVVLSMTDVKSQAFADVNVPEFTGASVACLGDTSQDGTMSIVIGLSICALVVLVLLGLVMNHLRDKDRSFKVVENLD
ncbi:hypothetical protein P879_02166 [Paragonimus westermani]|uniref:Uncharacterized protein n=1 Tax=Paragonimus westermani TaxID=34504 RepID=A0A8T0DSX9_9TREM|nr:hypothetical protein P879_02166 [Paragonimus westermani]